MSLALIRTQVDRFLETETPEVMAIKGAWGVGKSFAWNKFITEASRKKKIDLDSYSYVSLFGLNSLDELKLSIFMGVVQKDLIGTELSGGSIARVEKKLSSLTRRAIQLLRGLPWSKDFWPAIQTAFFYSLRKSIICIDDFERKGKALEAQDIMGMVSFLKEQRQCKIVLIFNDQSLEEQAAIDYKKYREKVVDIELLFNPTASECTEIALPTDKVAVILKSFIESLKINNIRIIKKIETLSKIITPLVSGLENEVLREALQTLVLFTWSFYNKSKSVPDYEFLKTFNYGFVGFGKEEKDELDEEKSWKAILRQYGYLNTDELDLQVAYLVEQGYVNENDFVTEARKRNGKIIESKSKGSFTEAWEAFHYTFGDNEEEVVQGIFDSFKNTVKYISILDLNATASLFRELGRDVLADQVIDIYIMERQNEKRLFALDSNLFRGNITDKVLIEKFDKINESLKTRRTLRDVLTKIAGKDGWGGDDEEILSTASIQDYVDLFKTEKGPNLLSWIDTCLQFGRISNPSEKMQRITGNASEALRRIAAENRLNSLRVAKYGIKLKPEEIEKKV